MWEIDEWHLLPPKWSDLPWVIMYGEDKQFENPLDELDQSKLMLDLDV